MFDERDEAQAGISLTFGYERNFCCCLFPHGVLLLLEVVELSCLGRKRKGLLSLALCLSLVLFGIVA